MKFTRKKSFLDDTRYLFHMGRVSGNVFFSLQDSWFGTEMCLYTLHVLLEVAITWVHYAACLNVVIWEYRNVVTKAEEIFYILLSFFLITSKPIYYFFKRKTFQEIFARIDLDQHHDHPKRGRSAAKHLCLLVSNVIVHIIVCYFVGVPTKSYIAYNVVFAAEILIAFCEYSLMYFMVQHAKGQLRAINNVIGKLLTGGAVSTTHKSAGTLYSVVSALMDVHADARALISDFYSLFLPSIMTVVVLDVMMMTICIDYIVKSFMFGSYSNLDDAIMVSWSLYLFFMGGVQLVLGIVMWVDLPNEAQKTVSGIHDVWNLLASQDKVDADAKNLLLISLQLYNSKLTFSAYGFFNVDRTLLNKIVTAIITYVVILIQFEISMKSKRSSE